MNWQKYLSILDDREFSEIVHAIECAKKVRGISGDGAPTLTEEEKSMDFFHCVKSVRDRLHIDLYSAKLFVEKHGKFSQYGK